MEQEQDKTGTMPFTPVEEETEDEEFSEEDEQDSSSASSESGEWPITAAEQKTSKLSRTTSKVELCCSKQIIPGATNAWACYLEHNRTISLVKHNTLPIIKLFRVGNRFLLLLLIVFG